MKTIFFILLLFMCKINLLGINHPREISQIQLKIKVVERKIGYIEPVIITGEILNKSKKDIVVNSPYESTIQIRKIGAKDWIYIPSLNAISGEYRLSEPGTITIPANNTYTFNIGTVSWIDRTYRKDEKFDWYYKELGKYEIRLAYSVLNMGEKAKVEYSNIETFEVSNYSGKDASAFAYLKKQLVPFFFYDSFYYGSISNTYSVRMKNIKEICNYIVNNYKSSKFSFWAKLYLLEIMTYSADSNIKKTDVKKNLRGLENSNNPFIKERIQLLIKHLNE